MLRTLLTTNVRDENHLVEWVAHHILIGFSHIFINDHLSKFPVAEVLANAGVPRHRYTVRRIEKPKVCKEHLMQEMYTHALRNGYHWTINLDGDEFLSLGHNQQVQDFLGKYGDCDQVALNWLCFGTNFLLDHPEGKGLMETYVRSERKCNPHTKTFVHLSHRPLRVTQFFPHVYYLSDMSRSVNVFRQRLNPNKPYYFPLGCGWRQTPAFVVHYYNQAYNMYVQRKINLPRDDTGTFRACVPRAAIDKLYNDEENTEIMARYHVRVQALMKLWREYVA